MAKWPHSPAHLFDFTGSYMITGSTLHKEHFFKTPAELNLMENHLFGLAIKYEWRLEAWAIFSNHYHFVAQSPMDASTLERFVTHLHSITAKEINHLHNQPGRKVWFQYWDTQLTYQNSYFARLNYVMQNPVKHRIVDRAENYPWCSTAWFLKNASLSHQKVVSSYKIDTVQVVDDY